MPDSSYWNIRSGCCAAASIIPTEEERENLMRLGTLLDHDISDVMLVVKPSTYRRWLNAGKEKRTKPGRPSTPQATVNLVLKFATDNLTWGYKHLPGELKKLASKSGFRRSVISSNVLDIIRFLKRAVDILQATGNCSSVPIWKHL